MQKQQQQQKKDSFVKQIVRFSLQHPQTINLFDKIKLCVSPESG